MYFVAALISLVNLFVRISLRANYLNERISNITSTKRKTFLNDEQHLIIQVYRVRISY